MANSTSSVAGRMPTVLVVEDQSICRFIRTALSPRGYRVLSASVPSAQKMLGETAETADVLITNSPNEFAEFPGIPLLYVAACPDQNAIRSFDHALSLTKPFHPRSLFEYLERLVPSKRAA